MNGFVAPEIRNAGGDVANRRKVRTGGGSALHRDRCARNRFDIDALVTAVLMRALCAALDSNETAHRGNNAHHGGEHARDIIAIRQHHCGVAKPAGGVPRSNGSRAIRDADDLGPELIHIVAAEDGEREDRFCDIAVHNRLVVGLLAADGLDGEKIRARFCAAFECLQHALPVPAAPHVLQIAPLANVVWRDTDAALDSVFCLMLLDDVHNRLTDLDAPGGILGHRRQGFNLRDEAGNIQFSCPVTDTGDDLPIIFDHVGHGFLGDKHGGQREVDLRVDGSSANGHAILQNDRMEGFPVYKIIQIGVRCLIKPLVHPVFSSLDISSDLT
ncbi:hypothetical protein SDC9_111537 [bioreactor metagenome]|uniref:Uncharacterized protein n=1 Tax=bioreactor metagenome TaxID=1076179 RepID=A0A645BGR3_9ZZZZ